MTNTPLQQLEAVDKKWFYFHKNYMLGEKKGLRYLLFRIQRPLIKFHYKIYQFLNPKTPWLSPSSIDFLKHYLTMEMKGVEFGSGSSTHFFASRSGKLVSIEHHEGWYNKVTKQLKESGLSNVDYKLIAQEQPAERPTPPFYEAWGIDPSTFTFRNDYFSYFNALESYNDESFDYILIDGRARPESLFTCESKLKRGGLMILDNSERERYRIIFEKLKDWPCYITTSGVTDTTFWIKP